MPNGKILYNEVILVKENDHHLASFSMELPAGGGSVLLIGDRM